MDARTLTTKVEGAVERQLLVSGGQPEVELANPISTEMAVMRPSLLSGLITAARQNVNRGFADLALFELGLCSWSARTPYVRVTENGITAFVTPLHKVRAAWDEIEDIEVRGRFMGGVLTLALKSGRQRQIPLGYLAKGDRQALVQHVQGILAARARPDGEGPNKDALS